MAEERLFDRIRRMTIEGLDRIQKSREEMRRRDAARLRKDVIPGTLQECITGMENIANQGLREATFEVAEVVPLLEDQGSFIRSEIARLLRQEGF